jgi:hypothetical protein
MINFTHVLFFSQGGASNFIEEEAKMAEQRQRRQPDTNTTPHGLQHNPHQPNDKLALHRPEETIH